MVFFDKDVLPIFEKRCTFCHGAEKKRGGLDLRTVAALTKGGDSGTTLVPGKPDKSPLWEVIDTDRMPTGPVKLPKEEREIIRKWILSGAKESATTTASAQAAR
jgi:hypothetical protein